MVVVQRSLHVTGPSAKMALWNLDLVPHRNLNAEVIVVPIL